MRVDLPGALLQKDAYQFVKILLATMDCSHFEMTLDIIVMSSDSSKLTSS